jgi:hypothetical protein
MSVLPTPVGPRMRTLDLSIWRGSAEVSMRGSASVADEGASSSRVKRSTVGC